MHYLHCILVDVGRSEKEDGKLDYEDMKIEAHSQAESFINDYYNIIYGWREDNAGRWSPEYPHVILGAEDKERFFKELDEFKDYPMNAALQLLDMLKWREVRWRTKEELEASNEYTIIDNDKNSDKQSWSGIRVEDITINEETIRKIWKEDKHMNMNIWAASKILKLINGEYECDSCFYSTQDYSTKISNKTYNDCKKNPDEYALVFFDIHS